MSTSLFIAFIYLAFILGFASGLWVMKWHSAQKVKAAVREGRVPFVVIPRGDESFEITGVWRPRRRG